MTHFEFLAQTIDVSLLKLRSNSDVNKLNWQLDMKSCDQCAEAFK